MLGLHVYHKVGTSICHRNHGYVPVHLGSFNRRPIVFVAGLSSLYILSDMNIQQGCHCGKSDEEGTPWINLPTEAFLMLNGNKQVFQTAYRRSSTFPVKIMTYSSHLYPQQCDLQPKHWQIPQLKAEERFLHHQSYFNATKALLWVEWNRF